MVVCALGGSTATGRIRRLGVDGVRLPDSYSALDTPVVRREADRTRLAVCRRAYDHLTNCDVSFSLLPSATIVGRFGVRRLRRASCRQAWVGVPCGFRGGNSQILPVFFVAVVYLVRRRRYACALVSNAWSPRVCSGGCRADGARTLARFHPPRNTRGGRRGNWAHVQLLTASPGDQSGLCAP